MLTGVRLFPYDEPAKVVAEMLAFQPQPISQTAPGISPALDALVLRALQPDREQRFQRARDMAMALEAACPPAGALEVAAWVSSTAGAALGQRAAWVADAESKTPSNLTVAKGLPHASATPLGSGLPALVDSTQPFALDTSAGGRASEPSGERASAVEPPRQRRRPLLWIAMGTAAAALLVGGVAVLRGTLTEEPASVIMLPAAPSEPPPPKRAPDPVAPTANEAAEQSAPLPSVAAPGPRDGGAAAKATTAAARRAPPLKFERKSARRPDCAVPYTVDEKGIKRFRSECF
jgi:serine/threonine-protein kinase